MITSKTSYKRRYSRTNVSGMCAGEIWTNGENYICPRWVLTLPEPERLTYNPFNSVSFHRPTNLPMHTYSNPALICRVRLTDQRKSLAMQTDTPAVDLVKLPPLSEQGAFQKSMFSQP